MCPRSPSALLTIGVKMSRRQRAAAFVSAVAAALCLLSACVSITVPHAGEPVALQPGEAFVFGRIRMLNAQNEHIEYSAFWFDPWDQPFFGPGPRMTLELRQLFPPGGAFDYKAYPAPPVEKHGSFFWILPAGDYLLLGNPRLLGSERFDPAETATLAHFQVPASGGTIYLGTLIISVVFDFGNVVQGWGKEEAEYTIRGYRVVDDRAQELSQLRARFPAFPEPLVTGLMRAE
jgi:hypothetical protein